MLKEVLRSELQLPLSLINEVQRTASYRYRSFAISKKNGGTRQIHHPAPELKALQRWLLRHVVAKMPVHPVAYAYRSGRGIVDNARLHAGQNFLLRLDFSNFFPSLGREDIAALLRQQKVICDTWTDDDYEFFLDVVCRRRLLTIGAPTSPGLSNCLLYEFDCRVHEYCSQRGIEYSRYADDLAFSTSERNVLRDVPEFVRNLVRTLRTPKNLKLNDRKTVHLSRGRRRVVTGLVLTSTGSVSVGRSLKRRLRTAVYRHRDASPEQREWLAGMLAFVGSIEPSFINGLVLKFGAEMVGTARRAVRPAEVHQTGAEASSAES